MYTGGFDERVRLALLCDYALTSQEGKISCIGIFGSISFASLPANYPRFFVVVVAMLPPGPHMGRIRLLGPTGSEIIPEGPEMSLQVPEGSNETNLIIGFDNLLFEAAGIHQLQLRLDQQVALTLPFAVVVASDQQVFSPRGNA